MQVKDDDASKEHAKGAVLKADILEENNLQIMEGQKEENSHLFCGGPNWLKFSSMDPLQVPKT